MNRDPRIAGPTDAAAPAQPAATFAAAHGRRPGAWGLFLPMAGLLLAAPLLQAVHASPTVAAAVLVAAWIGLACGCAAYVRARPRRL